MWWTSLHVYSTRNAPNVDIYAWQAYFQNLCSMYNMVSISTALLLHVLWIFECYCMYCESWKNVNNPNVIAWNNATLTRYVFECGWGMHWPLFGKQVYICIMCWSWFQRGTPTFMYCANIWMSNSELCWSWFGRGMPSFMFCLNKLATNYIAWNDNYQHNLQTSWIPLIK